MKTLKRQETDFMKRRVIKLNQNLKRAKAIEQKNKQRLLAVNPNLDEGSGKSADYLPTLSTNFRNTVITRLLKLRFSFSAIFSNFAFNSFGIVMFVRVLSSEPL